MTRAVEYSTRGAAPSLTPAAWLRFDAIRRGLRQSRATRILEVGAGEGALAWRLAKELDYTGLEPDPRSAEIAARRLGELGRGRLIRGTTAALTGQRFDLICAFEVLEHLDQDEEELRRWRGLLVEGGYALISVPAHRSRFGPADELVGHARRYDREDLDRLLERSGFEAVWVEAWGAGLGHILEAARHVIARRVHRIRSSQGKTPSGSWLQPRSGARGMASALLALPFRAFQVPFRGSRIGIGWVSLARRVP